MISNCGKDEKGSYAGGKAGDQTGAEYSLVSWYNRPWNCILRHPEASVRSYIAKLATEAAKNDNIGYDQSERLTFWTQLQKSSYDPAAITTPCEADCSSSTASIIKAVGYRLNNAKLKSVSHALTTYGMRSALVSAGFALLTDSKYLNSDSYLLAGDILLNDGSHAAINVTNGSKADTSCVGGNVTSTSTDSQNSLTSSGGVGTSSCNTSTSLKENKLKQGDIVSILNGATWWTGRSIPNWVKKLNWSIQSISGDRAVLGKSEDNKYNIMSPIDVKYLLALSSEDTCKSSEQSVSTQSATQSGYTPLVCMMTQSTCYRGTSKMTVKGVLWHSTGANNPWLKRYVQPDDNASNKAELMVKLGTNTNKNDWNHISVQAGVNAFVGKLADGTVTSVQTMPWDYKPWGCGGGCNNGWIQFEICEDGLGDRSYFNAVYDEAVKLTAYLCKMYSINPYGTVGNVPTILCHQDSYKLGMGSNHEDVYHWFNRYGKTMNNVRDDVAKHLGISANTTAVSTFKYGSRELSKGDTGDDVKELQNKLISIGYKLPVYGADGDFGNETDDAVRKLQKDNNLTVDGVVGKNTYAAISKKLG